MPPVDEKKTKRSQAQPAASWSSRNHLICFRCGDDVITGGFALHVDGYDDLQWVHVECGTEEEKREFAALLAQSKIAGIPSADPPSNKDHKRPYMTPTVVLDPVPVKHGEGVFPTDGPMLNDADWDDFGSDDPEDDPADQARGTSRRANKEGLPWWM